MSNKHRGAVASNPPNEQLLTIPHAAKLLGIPPSTLRHAVNAGHVPIYKPFSKRVRVYMSEVRSAIANDGQGR